MGKNKKKCLKPSPSQSAPAFEELLTTDCFEGERLNHLLQKLGREIELAKESTNGLPEKIWIKQQFSIGVNEVTRVLQWMPKVAFREQDTENFKKCSVDQSRSAELQVVLLAADCNPRLLIKHIPVLASSRGVPVILIRDNYRGSLRLGELAKLKTAMAIGVKCKSSRINSGVAEILQEYGLEYVKPKSCQ